MIHYTVERHYLVNVVHGYDHREGVCGPDS